MKKYEIVVTSSKGNTHKETLSRETDREAKKVFAKWSKAEHASLFELHPARGRLLIK
jgi:hypothetical protein